VLNPQLGAAHLHDIGAIHHRPEGQNVRLSTAAHENQTRRTKKQRSRNLKGLFHGLHHFPKENDRPDVFS
jgi:hypothetical protein